MTQSATVKTVQELLLAASFDPGPLDGIMGWRTRAAITKFQQAHGLQITGDVSPSFVERLTKKPDLRAVLEMPSWIAEGYKWLGLHELRDNAKLRGKLKADGRTLGDPAKLPWCGDFADTILRLSLPSEPPGSYPVNPYLARNWSTFGKEAPEGAFGALVNFWRGKKNGTSGHVGFEVGRYSNGDLAVLGGNQSNAVTVARIGSDRLLSRRWPLSVPLGNRKTPLVSGNSKRSTNEA